MNTRSLFGSLSLGAGLLCATAAKGTDAMPFAFDAPLDAEAIQQLEQAAVQPVKAGDKRLDAWWETWLTFGTAAENGDIRDTPHWREGWKTMSEKMPFVNDPSDNKEGDFSVAFEVERAAGNVHAVGFHPGPFLQPWSLDAGWTLQLSLKSENLDTAPRLALIDSAGKRAVGACGEFQTDGKWHAVQVPLGKLEAEPGFNFGEVRAIQLENQWPRQARLWIDGVRLVKGNQEIGVTDKNLDQRIDEARRTRLLRMHESIVNSATLLGEGPHQRNFVSELSLWPREGVDVDEVNRKLEEHFELVLEEIRERESAPWMTGIAGPVEMGMYWTFGSRSPVFPGRLSARAEALLLEVLWENTRGASDIHSARMPSLWVWSSENHDSCWRSTAMTAVGIFRDHPVYRDREYPDHGYGPGFPGYGYPPSEAGEDEYGYYRHRGEYGPLSDGKRYSPPEHYEAWKDLWLRYFTDRAKNNFFLEQGGGYRGILLRHMYTVLLYNRDPELTERARMFLDLFWLKYAQNSLNGYQGGPKHRQAPNDYWDNRHDPFVTFQLGGPATGLATGYWRNLVAEMLLSDYELPRAAWRMMLDKKGMGSYVFQARGVGEENDINPRPEGTQNMFMLDGPQRMVRYRYNTPYYMLSSSLDSPKMIYGHLTRSQLWQGLQAPWSDAILCPIAPDDETGNRVRSIAMPIHGVQDRNVFVGYYDPLTRVRSPQWFPAWDRKAFVPDDVGDEIYWASRGWKLRAYQSGAEMLVQGWDEVVEQSGWVFAKAGPVYAAARIVVPEYDDKGNPVMEPDTPGKLKLRTEDCYTWNEDRTIFGNTSSDVMIIEAGTEEEFGTFAAFQEAIEANKLEVWMARLAPILIYRGSRDDAKEIMLNLEHPYVHPQLDGTPIDYELPWTLKSPFVQSEYKSGFIRAEYGGESLLLDFNTLERR